MGAGRYDLDAALLGADLLELVDEGASSRAQDASGVVCTMSSTALKAIQPFTVTKARRIAYHLRERGAVKGSAAISVTPPSSIGSRLMLEPICELISQTRTTDRPYTADVIRTVFHSLGTRKKTQAADANGSRTDPNIIGCVPEKGNIQAETPTTAAGARPSAHAPGRRFCRNSATATKPTNRPATGDAAVAAAARGAAHSALAQRL